ncbi:MAG: aldehyde dehydrogenase family protein [Zetaproteobacteria bacterium]|nr:MAG: aldehyde dehydrogenase family protein [Zetaproteobacteria bacterium]
MDERPHFPAMAPGGTHEPLAVTAPFDGRRLATVERSDAAGIDQALATAEACFRDRDRWLSVTERIAILERAIALMNERFEELARGAAAEGGKPLIDSRIEMTRCIDSFRLCIDAMRSNGSPPPVMGINPASSRRVALLRREPIGVVVAVSAFNHPLNLIAHQVGPAVASGCPVIVKPAEDTPLSCIRLVRILHEAGLPEAWCRWIVPQSLALAEALVTDPRVALFTFIGSARVGWHLRSRLAPGTRCLLEHGGVAPVVVAADADLEAALPGLIKGAFYHAGQVCVSVQRIFVHASIARRLGAMMAEAAEALRVGDPLDEATEVGPLIRPAEVDRVAQWVGEARNGGAALLCGGRRIGRQCYAPTVLFDPPPDAAVSRREVFGPVACLYPFDDLDDAIARANALEVAFQAAVYSRDIDTALHVADRLDASTVMINDHTAFRVDWMPFGGLRHSGLGIGGIPFAMRDMQVEKLTVIHSPGIGP